MSSIPSVVTQCRGVLWPPPASSGCPTPGAVFPHPGVGMLGWHGGAGGPEGPGRARASPGKAAGAVERKRWQEELPRPPRAKGLL